MLTLMLLFQIAAAAQQPSPGAATPAQPDAAGAKKTGVIEGRVVNGMTGEAIRKANITLRPYGVHGVAGTGSAGPLPAPAPYIASTDAEGKFRIENVEAGDYRMTAERQGFVRQEYGARQNATGTTVKVAPGQELRELNFKLLPQAVVTGRVIDEEGEPLARVQIQVLRLRYFRGKRLPMPAGGGMTLDTGEFRVSDLPPGQYWLSATYRGQTMLGEVPARNTADKPEEAYATTYYPNSVDFAGAGPLQLQAGQTLPGIDIRIRKARVYRIRGKVTGTGSVRNVRLMVMPRDSSPVFGFSGMGTMVKEDGTFEVGGIQQGSYYLTAMPMQGTMASLGKVAFDVGRENVDNLSLVLGGASNLRGIIRIEGDLQQAEQQLGTKITFERVRLQAIPVGTMMFGGNSALAKDDGSFSVEGVTPDRYRLMLMNIPQATYIKSIRVGDQDALAGGFELSSGALVNVQVTLGIGVGEITGVVQNAKQQPAPGATVTLIPTPAKEERTDLYRVASTDQNGQFQLQGIAPGEYKLYAWEDIEPGVHTDPEFLKAHEARAEKLSIKTDSQNRVTLTQVAKELTVTP